MKKLQERRTRKYVERDEAERSSLISLLTHSGSTEEDEKQQLIKRGGPKRRC
jgi:hypothetical protein